MTEGNPGSTGWAAFEARMRNRRFARCIERTAAGLESGAMEDVRDALDEARILCPDAPEIAELESRIAALPSPSAVLLAPNMSVQEPPAGWLRVIGAMCVLVLLFGLFGFGLAQLYFNVPMTLLTDAVTSLVPASLAPRSATPPTAAGSNAPAPSAPNRTTPKARASTTPPPDRAMRPEPVPETAEPRAVGTTSRPARDARATRLDAPLDAKTPGDQAASKTGPAPRVERSSPPVPPIAEPERWTHPPDSPAPAVRAVSRPEAAGPVTDPVLPLESPILSPSAAPPRAVPASTAAAAASMARGDESAQIRLLLSRYETAYNRLDATAASSVWPGIDRAALDRAFKGLISQRVSLGLCDITVVGDVGGASCAGKARWEPRVGGGLQTADRYWTFNLRKGGEGWRIEQIRVR